MGELHRLDIHSCESCHAESISDVGSWLLLRTINLIVYVLLPQLLSMMKPLTGTDLRELNAKIN